MKYVDIYSVRKMDNYISQDKVNAIQLYYKADLERLLCCNKVIGTVVRLYCGMVTQ